MKIFQIRLALHFTKVRTSTRHAQKIEFWYREHISLYLYKIKKKYN